MSEEQRKNVLVVDDTEANVDILVEILDPFYDVSVAMDGEGALESVDEESPDLILLDIMMPGMDGYEVCRRLKAGEKTKDIPVIFVTAKGEIDEKMDGYDVGGSDYITKPVDPDFVLETIKKYIAK
jgi:putative two-component system response regulator